MWDSSVLKTSRFHFECYGPEFWVHGGHSSSLLVSRPLEAAFAGSLTLLPMCRTYLVFLRQVFRLFSLIQVSENWSCECDWSVIMIVVWRRCEWRYDHVQSSIVWSYPGWLHNLLDVESWCLCITLGNVWAVISENTFGLPSLGSSKPRPLWSRGTWLVFPAVLLCLQVHWSFNQLSTISTETSISDTAPAVFMAPTFLTQSPISS